MSTRPAAKRLRKFLADVREAVAMTEAARSMATGRGDAVCWTGGRESGDVAVAVLTLVEQLDDEAEADRERLEGKAEDHWDDAQSGRLP